ncbi:hypothetical protein ABT327_22660 [Streptomyces pilosus]|nr:hypothetical protein [Streptomyces pilosus]
MHHINSPEVRIEQTRRPLAKLRREGLIDRITLPQAGRTRVWHSTQYGAQLAGHGPTAPIWRPVHDTDHRVDWMHTRHL